MLKVAVDAARDQRYQSLPAALRERVQYYADHPEYLETASGIRFLTRLSEEYPDSFNDLMSVLEKYRGVNNG